ncbi:IS30 family transposase (plasmid) [Acidovorax sp. DW039]|uniref:IS30 family transposase n=1 Tax=Acidovorax sp. DW039 TaxID=3095606 RepID=UPI00308D7427|nr:IS30 family transposase [Acidovorax sp. DW039]
MNYTHLSQSERYQIQSLVDVGLSISQTALRLERHRSTIAREIRRRERLGAGQLSDRVGIAQRPAIVDERARLGDWEGDTIVSGRGALAALVTLTERRSRYTLAQHVPRRKAEPVGQAIIEMLRPHPKHRHTLTLDNGKEFAEHKWVQRRLSTKVYFADPHSSWQRGLNENHNGLLRHYFPKGSTLSLLSQVNRPGIPRHR